MYGMRQPSTTRAAAARSSSTSNGTAPPLPRICFLGLLCWGSAPLLRRVVLHGRDLTYPQLGALYRDVRSTLGGVQRKRLPEQARVLARMVKELGGPPKRQRARPTTQNTKR